VIIARLTMMNQVRKGRNGAATSSGQDFGDAVCASSCAKPEPRRSYIFIQTVWVGGCGTVEKGLCAQAPCRRLDRADALNEGWTPERVCCSEGRSSFLSPYLDADEREAPLSGTAAGR
jgi:hypothetical protein